MFQRFIRQPKFKKCTKTHVFTHIRHQNLKKCSKHPVPHVLRIFSSTFAFRHSRVFDIWTYKSAPNCAFRHSRVPFFDIGTYKSAPNTSCFVHFHFHICVSPQRRAIFRHLNVSPQPCFRHLNVQKCSKLCFSPQPCAIFRHRNVQKCSKHLMFCAFSFPHLRFATAACNFSTSERTKVFRTPHVLYIFTSKCAFRHSGVDFFDISTYKSASKLTCFVHFHFRTCFSPQRRAFFWHLNLQKCSEHVMFCTFSLPNVLFATAACIFLTSELTKVLRTRHVLYILTSECAFRHSGVQFLLSSRTTWLRTRRFNRPTFRLTWHTNHWKNTAFRNFSNISRACIFVLLTFWLLHLLSTDLTTLLLSYASVFQLSILSEVSI